MQLHRKPFRPKRSPLLAQKLSNPKYESWRSLAGRSVLGGGCLVVSFRVGWPALRGDFARLRTLAPILATSRKHLSSANH